MHFSTLLISLAAVTTSLAAEPIPLWPHSVPGQTGSVGAETNISKPGKQLVSGKPVIRLSNISNPTITIYPPSEQKNTGVAVVVCPGGGYKILAYDLEGTEICDWLNSIGITGVLLKYRVPALAGHPAHEAPLQDAQRAVRLVRENAAQWHIETNRVGILGFSAGGHLSALLSCQYDKRAYPPIDAADELSCRPDFAVLVYPGALTRKEARDKLAPELTVTSNNPPTFLVQAEDDPVHVENSVTYFLALKNAHVPAELHVFTKGGHGYGLRPSGNPISHWPVLVEQWLRSRDILP